MKRRLTPDEQALWDHVAAGVAPRRRRAHRPQPAPPEPALHAHAAPAEVQIRARPVTLKPEPPQTLQPLARLTPAPDPFAAPQLDGKRTARFLKGELAIEGRIDLHGMTLDLAHKALAGFVVQARSRGHRVVLVITGKGVGKGGALKRMVPMWLSAPPFTGLIAGLSPAQPRHGGDGALYLYLRRKRD